MGHFFRRPGNPGSARWAWISNSISPDYREACSIPYSVFQKLPYGVKTSKGYDVKAAFVDAESATNALYMAWLTEAQSTKPIDGVTFESRRPVHANKYGAKKVVIDGHTFASQKEGRRYSQLKVLQGQGIIKLLQPHPRFALHVNGQLICRYIGDFRYIDSDGQVVVEDTKGVITDVYKIKKKLMKAIHNIEIREV